jgi:hypothetical protein
VYRPNSSINDSKSSLNLGYNYNVSDAVTNLTGRLTPTGVDPTAVGQSQSPNGGPTLVLVQGTNQSFDLTVTEPNGTKEDLATDKIELFLRDDPTSPNNLLYKSTDIVSQIKRLRGDQARVFFTPADSNALFVGQPYFYKFVVTRADGTIFDAIEWSPVQVTLGGVTQPTPAAFAATVKIDHDYGLSDALRYMTPGGTPIAEAQIRIYDKADFDAGQLQQPIGISRTDAFGRWQEPILVEPGHDYVVQFFLPKQFGPDTVVVTA